MYVGASSGDLHAIDLATGTARWKYKANEEIGIGESSPVVTGARVRLAHRLPSAHPPVVTANYEILCQYCKSRHTKCLRRLMVFPIAQTLLCVQRKLTRMTNMNSTTHTTNICSLLPRTTRLWAIGIVALAAIVLNASAAAAQSPLESAQYFGVLGASTVTNTGPTTINGGDLGVSPGTAITGFPPGAVLGGATHAADAVASQANTDAFGAYNNFLTLPCDFNYADAQELGGMALGPGVHCFPSSAFLTGTLTLNGSGQFVFRMVSTIITASGSSVVVNDGSTTCRGSNVYWVATSSATLGTNSEFSGTIIALASITMTTGAELNGRALALTGAVTMDTNTVNVFGENCRDSEDEDEDVCVTGTGQIPVPNPNNGSPYAGGTGRATFGINAKSVGGAHGSFTYRNNVTGLQVRGTVTDIQVLAVNPDGSPMKVRFSGLCDGVPSCSFVVDVEDHGDPGRGRDQFGITITGGVSEVRSQRVISQGNIAVTR